MARRSILDVMDNILKVLSKEGEMSVKKISEKVKSQWETTFKALKFLKKHGLVVEVEEYESHFERIFRINK